MQTVRCFLLADAIKENVKYDKEIINIEPNPITYYKDMSSPYYKHFLFVQNAFDFYQIICAFFTKSYLSDILNDETVPEDIERKLNDDVYDINRQLENVKENIMFTEGNRNV